MSSTVKAANWRFVEVGRVVLVDNKELATIVEIIDQKEYVISELGRRVLSQGIEEMKFKYQESPQ